MESMSRKRRGFMKGKLVMSFSRAAKPSSSTMQYSTKVKSSPSSSSTANSMGFHVNRDYVIPQPKQKVSFIIPDNGRDSFVQFENHFGAAGDESVDMKASSYISGVQERFRLE